MKKSTKLASILMAALLTGGALAGCGDSGSPASSPSGSNGGEAAPSTEGAAALAKKDEVTLKFIVPQDGPINDWDLVLAEFESRTKDTLNVKLDLTVTGFDDIGQKVSLKLTTGEQVDSVFAAQWTNPSVQSMALKGQVAKLDSYFESEAYPGLKNGFDAAYLEQNKFPGKDGARGVYAIPFAHEYGSPSNIYYRLDLAEKYGIGEIKTWDDMFRFFDAVKENEPGMDPFVFLGSTDGLAGMVKTAAYAPVLKEHNFQDESIIKDDGTAYVSGNIVPALDPEYAKWLPEGALPDGDALYDLREARRWYEKGYISKDIMNIKDHQGMFCNGKAAAFPRGLDTYTGIKTQLESGVPGAKLGIANLDPNKDLPKNTGCDFQAWNFACIPANAKNIDRTMEFYSWLFEDQANHDLFEYGIEGKHWVAEGSDAYTVQANPDTGKNYNFGAFVMTWSPTNRRYESGLPQQVLDGLKLGSDASYFFKNIKAGFAFDSEPVKAIDAQRTEIKSSLLAVQNGTVADIEGEIAKINDRLKAIKVEEWTAEYQKQLNAYLTENPYRK